MNIIEARGLTRTFNDGSDNQLVILKGVDFSVAEGQFVSVVGASGSGKSTLMNILGLLDRPNRGSYLLGGQDVLAASTQDLSRIRGRDIGFVFQSFNLIGRMSAVSNVEVPMMYAGVSRKARRARATELLDLVGMGERADHEPNQLSGGQKQRVAIARAMANEPKILLADEPTGALDSETGRMVMDLFHHLNHELGTTIVLITHNPELAEETHRVVTMVDGNLTEEKR